MIDAEKIDASDYSTAALLAARACKARIGV
jgi:hypothetical protein